MLVNLVWLDLSFNNIEKIEGLDTLVKLEDLSLFNNRISLLENMETLTNLHIVSLGNNDFNDLNSLLYLRQFKKLKTVCISGNPMCMNEDYKLFTTAHLPNLDYIDYRAITTEMRTQANEKYRDIVEELIAEELSESRKQEEALIRRQQETLHKAAFVDLLDGSGLFDSMYESDPDGNRLQEIPEIKELVDSFREQFVEQCHQIFEFGIKEHNRRQEETDQFLECLEEAKTENRHLCVQQVKTFLTYKKTVFPIMLQTQDVDELDSLMEAYNEKLSKISSCLTGLELQLVDQLEETIKEFERNISDMITAYVEQVQAMFAQCRELENMHNEKLVEQCAAVLDKVIHNSPEVEALTEDLRLLFVDKDSMNNAISSSHENHIHEIDTKEDCMITGVNDWVAAFIGRVHEEEEVKRNRHRIMEINHFIDYQTEELDNLELEEAPVDQ
ncbi:PREDICTED: leucine-rich repeat-containing protein 48-like isoform X2 [Priapulus caudatus]|nr:PREDICTED: leucine-rich repeat-containing protein 48-like isoform X2 [Priapulus caudatus]XP_014663215.1 PREDICTED: leucine-rich repeat-containing protein 48-like isoform X2 [Priapulus caudatus]